MGLEYILTSPLLLIFILSIVMILIDAFSHNKKAAHIGTIISLILVGAAAAYTLTVPAGDIIIAKNNALSSTNIAAKNLLNMVTVGGYAAFFDIIFCLAAILTLFAAKSYIRREYKEYNEFYSLVLFAVSGMMFISHADNFLILFIGIEIMSITFYVLAGYFRVRRLAVEAALKYFLLGAFATGFLLYGMALIYGATGSLDLSLISQKVASGGILHPLYMNIGLGLIVIGLSFKIAAFPFHQWAPDVYNGSPTVVTGFMSTAGKAAAVIAFIIVAKAVINPASAVPSIAASSKTILNIIAVISAATMLIGNITALVQKNVKRMLSYSSVAHAGYMLMGIVANNSSGMSGILFYATAYMFMQTGAFVVISILERDDEKFLELEHYSGLRKSHPALAAAMAMFMFSLAGIPPFAGFFGKYFLFKAAIDAGFLWLTIVAVISSIISMYFYIGLIIQMYFKEQDSEFIATISDHDKVALAPNVSLIIAVAGILVFGILPSLIVNLTAKFF